MKTIFTLIISVALLPALFAQSEGNEPSYSLLFADVGFQPDFFLNYTMQDPYLNTGEMQPAGKPAPKAWKPIAVTSGLLMISGFCDGTSEVLKIKYNSFERVFPGANDQFWDYNISWKNKYKDGNPPDPAFFGSKTAFVWTTDGYHMMRAFRNATMITALVIPLQDIRHKTWKQYLQEGIINYFSYTVGFNLAYDVVFK